MMDKIRKMILVVAMTFFIVTVTTGLVAAKPAEIDILPDSIDLVPGEYVDTTAHLYDMYCDGSSRTLTVSVESGNAGDLTFKVYDPNTGGTAGPMVGSISYTYTPVAGTTEYDITVKIKAATGTQGNEYELYYEDVQTGSWDKASATVHTTAIPEFATIALPLAATIGLFFFFNRRRRA